MSKSRSGVINVNLNRESVTSDSSTKSKRGRKALDREPGHSRGVYISDRIYTILKAMATARGMESTHANMQDILVTVAEAWQRGELAIVEKQVVVTETKIRVSKEDA